ncbi:hypothetical protein ABIE16_002984 [Pseudomonas sp. 2725]|jgi:hypothetical protein
MSAWINTGMHAGLKQLRNSAIAATVLVCRWPDPLLAAQRIGLALLHRPLSTARSSGRQ